MRIRVGQGFDAHRFRANRRLVLGGVDVPHSHGLEAHSDGDVLLHAITDALLGAIGAGDLGSHFPDSDPALAGIDSRSMLRRAFDLAAQGQWAVANVDATIIAQTPRLGSHLPAMTETVATSLEIGAEAVNLKATTTERMGFTGREEGIAAMAVLLVTGD